MRVLESSTKIAFKNSLFLTDFSEASQTAMEYAVTLTKHHQATLYPAHVQNATPPVYLEGAALMSYFDAAQQQSQKKLTQLVETLGVNAHVLVSEGAIEYAVQRWTALHGIDLIVIGTHGWKGLPRLLLGSTAELILRSATCPVLTVGPHVSKLERNPEYIDRVVFATDLTQQTEYALSYALSFAHERCAYLTLLHVLPKTSHVPDADRVRTYCENQLRSLVPADAGGWCDPRFVIAEGDPAQEIVNYAETNDSDLIVLGLPKNKVFNTYFRSGVTYNVVASASCPVLTVRDMLPGS